MSQFIESLARLYRAKRIDHKKLIELLSNKKINKQEYEYILNEKGV